MCGRYALPIDPESLPEWFARQNLIVKNIQVVQKKTNKNYNIAPTSYVPIYMKTEETKSIEKEELNNKDSRSEDNKEVIYGTIEYMRWGLVPAWSKSKQDLKKKPYTTFNARLENLDASRTWKSSLGNRCIIPMIGYYEWTQDKRKIPYFIKRRDGELMFMAGLYNHFKLQDSDDVFGSFTLITRDAPQWLSWLHKRIPVILDPKDPEFLQWLNGDLETDTILHEYKHQSKLEWYKVDPAVGDVSNDKKGFVLPQKDVIAGFFNKKQKTSK